MIKLNHKEEQENHTTNELSPEDITDTTVSPQQRKKGSKKTSLLAYVLSGIAGGVISATLIVVLLVTNVIPISEQSENKREEVSASESATQVSTDLISDNEPTTNIENVTKAVVGVSNLQQRDVWSNSAQAGAGTGVIYKKENGKAYIVTNHHVVSNAEEVRIDLSEDKQATATILGTDPLTDLAVLQIDDDGVEAVASFSSSKDLEVGETVIAIGNPLGSEFAGSVTKGIISGLERSIEVDTNGDRRPDWITEVIQTDAAINPGNSGGALVNSDGKVIGINSMKIATQEVEGIGFAIPSDTTLPVIEQLETDGEVARPLIGISTAAVHQVPLQYQHNIKLPDGVEGGMVIADVQAGSPAAKAGLQQFDVITKINGEEVNSILDLRVYMYKETEVGDTLTIEYVRNGELESSELTLTEPKEMTAPSA